MWVWVDRLSGLVWDATAATAVLLCLVASAMLSCRQPARRVHLARAGIVSALALLPLAAALPWPRVNLIEVLHGIGFQTDFLFGPVGSNPTGTGPGLLFLPAARRLLMLLYLTGAAILGARLLLGCWGLGWLIRRSSPPSDFIEKLYLSLPWREGRSRPPLRVSDRVGRPVVIGAVRQSILIPAGLARPDAAASLRLGLNHELAHAGHADPWFNLAGNLAHVLWFFQPPLWWVRSQLKLDQEFLADRRAAVALGPLSTYASSLVEQSAPESERPARTPSVKTGTDMPGTALVQRTLMLVRCPFKVESSPPVWWCWSASFLVFLVSLAASTFSIQPSEGRSASSTSGDIKNVTQLFQMTRLVVPAQSANSHGRAPLFELPIRLPTHFELNLEVWGDSQSLASTRVVGHRLGTPRETAAETFSIQGWHRVRVQRDPNAVALTLDGQSVPIDPGRNITTTWLAVETAPDRTGRFRNLSLRWIRTNP